ncbi:MAG TPA: ABC transporter ATP-binding protein, partial [Casimicrobiaceae bacterium]|nr:ABC transporter ATP-binding protein [Casimicrobiaceae bacterium]
LLLAAIASAWLKTLERRGAEALGQCYAADVRMALYDCIVASPMQRVHKRRHGALLMRFVGDLKALRRWVSLGVARLCVGTVTIVVAISALAFVNAAMAIAVAVVVGAAATGCSLLGRSYPAAVREARRQQSRLASEVNEKIGAIAVAQLFGQTARERAALAGRIARLSDAAVAQTDGAARIRAVADALAAMVSAAVLLTGAVEVRAGVATVAMVAAALTVTGFLVPAMRDLAMAYVHWHSARVARAKLESLLAQQRAHQESVTSPPFVCRGGRVEFVDVHVDGALAGFSAAAESCERVAIVGPNGAGKSTLLRVAARLVTCDAGRVLIDGQDLAQHSRVSVQAGVGMVGPDLPLLSGTIEYNLRYRCPDAPAHEVNRIAVLCGVDEIVDALPDGLASRLSEAGANLSTGHRTRIALARALLGRPQLLLLDEVDANLDPRSALIIDRVLDDYGGTVLIVTHRLERITRVDTVWHVAGGTLIESGDPRSLLDRRGATSLLFQDAMRRAS